MVSNANEIDFRCSSLGYIMPGAREKAGQLADGVITHLVDVYVSAKYGRREEAKGKMLDKGNAREEDSITLLSRINKKFYKKNDVRLSNGFITGELDVYEGESVDKADHTTDTKTSWSAHTFFRAQKKELDWNYKWQGVGYMWLSGAKKHTVAYCLVNGTATAIMDEKRRLGYQFNVIDPSSKSDPKYVAALRQVEINHIFDRKAFEEENPWFEFDIPADEWVYDIPMSERLFQFTIERNEDEINQVRERVKVCRDWMNENLFGSNPELEEEILHTSEDLKPDFESAKQKIEKGKMLRKKVGV